MNEFYAIHKNLFFVLILLQSHIPITIGFKIYFQGHTQKFIEGGALNFYILIFYMIIVEEICELITQNVLQTQSYYYNIENIEHFIG